MSIYRQIRNIDQFVDEYDFDDDPFEAFLHRELAVADEAVASR